MITCVSLLVLLAVKPGVLLSLSSTAPAINSPTVLAASVYHKTDLKLLLDITNIYVVSKMNQFIILLMHEYSYYYCTGMNFKIFLLQSVKVNRHFRAMNETRRQLLKSIITKLVKLTDQQTAVQNLLDDEAENASVTTVAMKTLLDTALNKSYEWVCLKCVR